MANQLQTNSSSQEWRVGNIPAVAIKVFDQKHLAYLDTGARTSIAGKELFELFKDKTLEFQTTVTDITLADGVSTEQTVYITSADVQIGKRLERISFVCLPNATQNKTLLGCDFLEKTGVVINLPQQVWFFKDEPLNVFSFKAEPPQELEYITEGQRIVDVKILYDLKDNSNAKVENKEKSKEENSSAMLNTLIPDDASAVNANSFALNANEAALLNMEQKMQLNQLLEEQKSIFGNITKTITAVEHFINSGEHAPIATAPYSISLEMKKKLYPQLQQMLNEDLIDQVESPWAFPVVLIPRANDQILPYIDYRSLNAITAAQAYTQTKMEDLLQAAKTTRFMSTLDMKPCYFKMQLSKEARLKTAFATPFENFVFNQMPEGLKNARVTFQRLMDKIKMNLPNVLILSYMDDIIICSKDFQSHLEDLKTTFQELKTMGIRLIRKQCCFCKPEIKILNRILSANGLKPDLETTSAMQNHAEPRNVKHLKSFLEICSCFADFMPNFEEITKPLLNLTKDDVTWNWSNTEKQAFNDLKLLLSSPPIVEDVKENEPFFIYTNASNYALGAVLMQSKQDHQHPIAYASRLMLKSELKYSATEKQALAVIWGLYEFRGYLETAEVTIFTDHQPLEWMLSLKSPSGRLARLPLLLQIFNFKFSFTPQKYHIIALTLANPPCSTTNCNSVCECSHAESDFERHGAKDFALAQKCDPEINKIIQAFEKNDNEHIIRLTTAGYMLNDDVLYRYCADQHLDNGQIIVPKQCQNDLLFRHHCDSAAGHLSIEKTFSSISRYYYWSGMKSDVPSYVKACGVCNRIQIFNSKPQQRFENITLQLLGPLPVSNEGHHWILIVEDIDTRWIELFALKEATAEECALTLLNEIILRYGVPSKLQTELKTQLICAVIQKLTYCLGIRQSTIQLEEKSAESKINNKKMQLLRDTAETASDWNTKLPAIRFSLNSDINDVTGCTPAYLTFRKEFRAPTDSHADFKKAVLAEKFVPKITPHLLKLAEDLNIVNEHANKTHYADRKRKPEVDINIGDLVVVESHVLSNAKQGTILYSAHKDTTYIVTAKQGSTYTIADADELTKPIATLQSSDLILCFPENSQAKRNQSEDQQLEDSNSSMELDFN